MALVKIMRMYKRNIFGDYAATTVTFNGFDSKNRLVLSKEMTGKIGAEDESGNYTFDLGGMSVARVEAIIPNNHVCQWDVSK